MIRFALTSLALIASTTAFAAAPATHRYAVTLDQSLRTISVRACFDDPPKRLRAGSRAARDFLGPVRAGTVDGTERRLNVRRGAIATGDLPPGTCIAYKVDIGRAADRRVDRRNSWVGNDLLTTPETWLWRSTLPRAGRDMTIDFVLPDGVNVSAPWSPNSSAMGFDVGPAPYDWSALVAFGAFEEKLINIPGATVRLAVLSGEDGRPKPGVMARWIEEVAYAITTLYGTFPQPSPQVLVVPAARGGGPVPWGQVLRGGAPAAHFFVNPAEPLSAFRADWTAAHELSHMLLPLVKSSDRWLSEGFASYYQNVLRARAGLLDERVAWEKLHQGFVRGVNGHGSGTLRRTSAEMHRNRAYMRVYWSGAAIALLADIRLRELTDGRQSLDTALAQLKECCLDVGRVWSARELFDKLDELTETRVFSVLLDAHVDSSEFPDVGRRFIDLGIAPNGNRVALKDDAPLKWIRDAIMAPHDGRSPR